MKNTYILLLTVVLALVAMAFVFRFGQLRYFDADEFAYLHWTHNVIDGTLPYRDFLLYVPPGFLYIAAPLFWVSKGVTILDASRVFAFVSYVLLAGSISLIFSVLRPSRRSWSALPFFLLFCLPMPMDKLIEFRPDTLSAAFLLFGVWFQLQRRPVGSGVLYACAALILPKTVPQILFAFLLIGVVDLKSALRMLLGMAIPLVVFGVWVLLLGNQPQNALSVWYSLTALPLEVNQLGFRFQMDPDLYFYPNPTYYGTAGIGPGIVVNHALWIVGLLVGGIRLVTPFIPRGREGVRSELLVGGMFFISCLSFLFGFPMRHPQYLIPVAAFLVLYVADGIVACVSKIRPEEIRLAAYMLCLCAILVSNVSVIANKQAVTNDQDKATLSRVLTTVPRGSYVFDLVGITIYYRDPYVVSAVPFGQWLPYLSRPLPDLVALLRTTKTRYIYKDALGRVDAVVPFDPTVYYYLQ